MLEVLGVDGWDRAVEFNATADKDRAWTWGLDSARCAAVVNPLFGGQNPSQSTVRPWAAALRRGDGSVVATSSPTLAAGLFYSLDKDPQSARLIIGTSLSAVVRSRGQPTTLSRDFLAARLGHGRLLAEDTPYGEIHRLPPGTTAEWRSPIDAPRVRQWCGPESWPEPRLEGSTVIDSYRRTFDDAVDELVIPGEPICATLSGGLDSSFLVASLLRHATPSRPVHAFVHSPTPAAQLQPRGSWDPDEYAVALAMRRRYPTTLKLHRVFTPDDGHALDAAVTAAEHLWYPGVNSWNLGWLRRMTTMAADLGASRLFVGENGNSAFSYDHTYALRFHAGRGQWRALHSMTKAYPSGRLPGVRSGWELLAHRLGGDVRSALLRQQPFGWRHTRETDFGSRAQASPRRDYLQWLAAAYSRSSIYAFAGWPVGVIDPFRSATVLELAAAMTPATWARGGSPRGLARLIGEGRVPDEIRLRKRRGGQSWDGWFLASGDRSRYLHETELAVQDPDLGPLLAHRDLLDEVADWPWGEPFAGQPRGWHRIHDVLATATFVRLTRERLRRPVS